MSLRLFFYPKISKVLNLDQLLGQERSETCLDPPPPSTPSASNRPFKHPSSPLKVVVVPLLGKHYPTFPHPVSRGLKTFFRVTFILFTFNPIAIFISKRKIIKKLSIRKITKFERNWLALKGLYTSEVRLLKRSLQYKLKSHSILLPFITLYNQFQRYSSTS